MPQVQVRYQHVEVNSLGEESRREWVELPVMEKSLSIESIVGQTVDTCSFTVYDKNREYHIPTMSEVEVRRTDTDERIFGGLAVFVQGKPEGFTRWWYVSCQDYTILLARTLCLQNFPAGYDYEGLRGDKAVIASAFEVNSLGPGAGDAGPETQGVNWSGIEARTNVQQGLETTAQLLFRYSTLQEIVVQLAGYAGYDFYVDYDKSLHYYYRESELAPFELSDGVSQSVSVLQYRNCSWRRDGTRLLNTFALFGNHLRSDPQVSLLRADGSQTHFLLNTANLGHNFNLIAEAGGGEFIRVDIEGPAKPLTASTHTGATSRTQLTVAGGDFVNDGVVVGDIVLNQTDGSWGRVTQVTATTITGELLNGTNNEWEVGDVAVVPTWVAQTLGNRLIPGSGIVFHDSGGKTLDFDTPPPVGWIRLRYAYNFAAGQIETDFSSYNRFGRQVLARRVVVSDVNSYEGISLKLGHLKEQYSEPLEVVRCTLTDDMYPANRRERLRAGQWVAFTNSVLGRTRKEF